MSDLRHDIVEAFQMLDVQRGPYVDARRQQFLPPKLDVAYLIGQMRFGRFTVHAVLGPDMHLLIADLQPQPAAPFQRLRLLDFRQSQHTAVKRPRRLFLPLRNRDLCMMQS